MGYGAAEELVVLSPHPSSAAAEAAAAAAAEAAAGGRDPAALERKLSLARWRSGGGGSGKVVALVASSSNAAAAAAAAGSSSVPFEDERIEALERALAEASAEAIPDDDDHASFIRIPPPLRKSAARFFVKDKAVTRFWEKSTSEKTKNSTSTPAEVASAAAAAALGALRAARSALGARALLPAPPAVLVSLNPALADESEWRGSLLVAAPELGEESDDESSEDDEEKVAAAADAARFSATSAVVVPPSVAGAVSGSLRKGRAAPDQRHCLEEVSAVFEVAEWVAHWSNKGFVLGLGR